MSLTHIQGVSRSTCTLCGSLTAGQRLVFAVIFCQWTIIVFQQIRRQNNISVEKPYSANNNWFHSLLVNDRQRASLKKVLFVEDLLIEVIPPFQQDFLPSQVFLKIDNNYKLQINLNI